VIFFTFYSISAKVRGVIKSEKYHAESIEKAIMAFAKFGYIPSDIIKSPIKGGSGNIEYLIMFNRGERAGKLIPPYFPIMP
jgi:predicted rRNA methylase YqxC with S4 and FtsJ domains